LQAPGRCTQAHCVSDPPASKGPCTVVGHRLSERITGRRRSATEHQQTVLTRRSSHPSAPTSPRLVAFIHPRPERITMGRVQVAEHPSTVPQGDQVYSSHDKAWSLPSMPGTDRLGPAFTLRAPRRQCSRGGQGSRHGSMAGPDRPRCQMLEGMWWPKRTTRSRIYLRSIGSQQSLLSHW
jgi:hypothetical protein